MKSTHLSCLEILDSRGIPTLYLTLTLDDGSCVSASVPSGTSSGKHEAVQLRDNDPQRYAGLGVLHEANNALSAFDVVKDKDVSRQRDIDLALIEYDGSENKSRIGANAIFGISLVMLKAGAHNAHMPLYQYIQARMLEYFKKDIPYRLPSPIFTLIEAGEHTNTGLDFGEFLILSTSYAEAKELMRQPLQPASRIRSQIQQGTEIYHRLTKVLADHGNPTELGSEKDVLNLVCEAIRQAGYKLKDEISLGIDASANSFYDTSQQSYVLNKNKKHIAKQTMDATQLHDFYTFFLTNYPLMYLEDPFFAEDWDAFTTLLSDTSLPGILYAGDELTTTNPKRLHTGIEKKAINTILIKPNQIGTIYETMHLISQCIENDIIYVLSQQPGETIECSLTDVAVGTGALFLKAGAPIHAEHNAKYNRLLEIADEFENQ